MDYETPTCIKCEREWAGDYPVCMLCAPDTHFPHRSDCIHCEMLTDLQSKDRAFELMLEALEHVAAAYKNSIGFRASAFRAVMPRIEAAIKVAKEEQ